MKKKLSLTFVAIIILIIAFYSSFRSTTSYGIRYKEIDFTSKKDKDKFEIKLTDQLEKLGYRKQKIKPKWVPISFYNEKNRHIIFMVNEKDKKERSLFYIEDHPFKKHGLNINYRYVASSHPFFIDYTNNKLRKTGLELTKKIPELVIDSDDYVNANGSDTGSE